MIAPAGNTYQGMTPGLALAEGAAAYWVEQATVRLRREIAWLWHRRRDEVEEGDGRLPPPEDRLEEALDLQRHAADKARFFREDVTARHLGDLLGRKAPEPADAPVQGTWDFLARGSGLDEAAQFVLGLCLAARLDAGLGPVLAACANDTGRPYPTLALAQRLWDKPLAVAGLADPGHPLFKFGLLAFPGESGHGGLAWTRQLEIAPWLAVILAAGGAGPAVEAGLALPFGLVPLLADSREAAAPAVQALAGRLRRETHRLPHLEILPLVGPRGCAFEATAAALGMALGRPCAALPPGADPAHLNRLPLGQVASACWFLGLDLLLPETWQEAAQGGTRPTVDWPAEVGHLPVRILLPVRDSASLKPLPAWALLPALAVPSLDYEGRRDLIRRLLGRHAPGLEAAVAEAARRFRFEAETLRAALRPLASRETVSREDVLAALALEASIEMGHLAEPASPRFTLDELVLPPAQHAQIREILAAMRHLAEVHYGWGTARAWNEGGLSALFCGAPGTGKTMAAEAVAQELGIPLHRIDLSQVVNKYIGETEKNLRRIFDATERADCVLFFDEADALFGKRTEVKDAHDRFANIEISYLLERMERFKGLAILASNRRKDIDEAFLRRLRHIVEFPMPGAAERERIWSRVFPATVDTSDLDLPYLARQFPLVGGHIRSIAFNACLLSAAGNGAAGGRRVGMDKVLLALKRELDKMSRPSGTELFGAYGRLLQGVPA